MITKDNLIKNPDQITKKIIKHCEQEDAVVAVYLFGSAAMNRMKPSSDLDVALLLESGSEATFPLLKFGTDLEKIFGRRIDLLILNRSGELIQYQVRRLANLYSTETSKREKNLKSAGANGTRILSICITDM